MLWMGLGDERWFHRARSVLAMVSPVHVGLKNITLACGAAAYLLALALPPHPCPRLS